MPSTILDLPRKGTTMMTNLRRLGIPGLRGRFLACLALVGVAALTAGSGRQTRAPADDPAAGPGERVPPITNVVRQGFPAAKADPNDLTKSETAWEIEWDLTHPENQPYMPPGSVLRIRSAKFMWKDRAGKPQWITVARMVELAEIYVPYDNGWTAFLDISDMPFNITPARKEFLGPNCVAPGEVLKSANPAWSERVYKEVHDDGIRWMSAEYDDNWEVADRARRGEKMIVWATYYGANYRYLIEYGFGDDGMMTCRIGPTGRNIFNRRDDLGDTHLHIGCWRMEFDLGDPVTGLGGPKENEVLLSRRMLDEEEGHFRQVSRPFNRQVSRPFFPFRQAQPQGQATEGSARWNPEEFTSLRVQSQVRKNAHGRPVAFDLIPQRYGALRQLQQQGGTYNANMEFINNDFWVTRTEPGFTTYVDVPKYASGHRPLTGYPTTVWTCTPALHFPRGEDFDSATGTNSYGGLAITVWAGFFIKPRDLFDSTPLYKPTPWPGLLGDD
jgi:hypothetical protein